MLLVQLGLPSVMISVEQILFVLSLLTLADLNEEYPALHVDDLEGLLSPA